MIRRKKKKKKVRLIPAFVFLNLTDPGTQSLQYTTREERTTLQKYPHIIPSHHFSQNKSENTKETKQLPVMRKETLHEDSW